MQAARERRCNGMVHTLSPASLPAGAITRRTKELNGVDTDMAIRIAAFTKVAFKGKLPPQQPQQQPYRKNGLTNSHPPTVHTTVESRVQKTQASPTPGIAPLTLHSTPHSLISRHCSTLVHSRNTSAEATHTTIDHRLSASLNRLRQKQLVLAHTHARRQIATHEQTLSEETTDETKLDSSNSSSLNDTEGSSIELPFFPSESKVLTKSVSDSVRSLQHHLECLESFVDDEMTCSSSDDEEEEMERVRGRERKNEVKRRWEQDRTVLGSKWAWLCHQVTSINQQIRHLNSHLQSCPPKDPVSLTTSTLLTTLPCVCQHKHNSNGITTPSLPKNSGGPSNGSVKPTTNGVCSPCPCQLRQMLLSNTSGSTPQFRVQELLGCNFPVLLMEESSQTCARTRPLQHPPSQRKLIRKKKKRRTGRPLDECHHPQLSNLGDYPSNLWLDSALHQILQEHSYASIPQPKRRKVTTSSSSFTSVFNTPVSRSIIRLERSRSFSPSPSSFDGSAEKGLKGIPRKRNAIHIPFSGDSDCRPATPTLPLSSRKKRGAGTPSFDIDNIVIPYSIACSTRLEKLEYKEIVTPKWRQVDSSTPAAATAAKLVNGEKADVTAEKGRNHKVCASRKLLMDSSEEVIKKEEEEEERDGVEDASDEAFLIRHNKCEAVERKRYLNFITGATRKRSRPSTTQASTPDSAHSPASFNGGDLEVTFLPQVLPWPTRRFPLVGKSLLELTNPSPPPQKTICSSPILSADHSSILSSSPLAQISTSPNQHNTPVTSPGGPLAEECPLAVSSSHWVVTNTVATPATKQPSIVLKLAKRS